MGKLWWPPTATLGGKVVQPVAICWAVVSPATISPVTYMPGFRATILTIGLYFVTTDGGAYDVHLNNLHVGRRALSSVADLISSLDCTPRAGAPLSLSLHLRFRTLISLSGSHLL